MECVEVGGSLDLPTWEPVTVYDLEWAVQRHLVTTGHPQGAGLKREVPAPLGIKDSETPIS